MKKLFFSIAFFAFVLMQSCVTEEPTPTKILMQGNWELTEAYDEEGNDILNELNFPITVIQLTDDNGLLGTHAPLATRTVYGDSKWIQAAGKMNQLFDYANLRFNTGEYFVGEGEAEVFTIEYKLQATAAAGALSDLLTIFGVANGWLQQTVYHKFMDVQVSFPDKKITSSGATNDDEINTMVWEFDSKTTAAYNYKDSNGNQVLWNGWPVDKFAKGRYVWTKKTESLNDLVKAEI